MRNYLTTAAILILSMLGLLQPEVGCKSPKEKQPAKESEDFDRFLEHFSLDSAFQLQRLSEGFLDCTVTLEADSTCEKIPHSKWRHLTLNEEQPTTVVHNSFNLANTSSERVLELDRDESAGANLYFFKRIDGEWFLVRRLTYED